MRVLWNVLTTVVVVIVVLLAVALAGVRVFGFTPYAVKSPSMTPAFPVGSLVYVRKTSPENVKVGDPITFVANESLTVVTHRVTQVTEQEDEKGELHYFYKTKGDANDSEDMGSVYDGNLLGVVRFHIPYLGYLSAYAATSSGKFSLIGVGFLMILVFILPDLFKKFPAKEK